MSLNKYKLIFDPADAANSDSVGSYVLAGDDGTAIGHTADALKVDIASSSGTLNTDPGAIQFDLDGGLVTVHKDSVTPTNSRALPVELTGASGPINITAGDLNVQLDHTGANADSTRIGDGTETVAVTTNNDMQVVDRCDDSLKTTAESVTATAAQLVAVPLTERKRIMLQNVGNKPCFVGGSSVTSANGIEISRGDVFEMNIGSGAAVWAICASGQSTNLRVLEAA